MNKKIKYLPLVALVCAGMSLVGCTSYSNKFDCPYGQGVGCASISKVDKMIDAHMIKTEEDLPTLDRASSLKRIQVYFGPNRPQKPLAVKDLPLI
jgi:hypothetical protein